MWVFILPYALLLCTTGAANFPTKHLLKDVRLFKQEAVGSRVSTGLSSALEAIISTTIDRGLGDADYSAVREGVLVPEEAS